MEKQKKRGRRAEGEKTFFAGPKSAASANECTGMITTPADSEEQSSYAEIYEIPVEGGGYLGSGEKK